MGYDELHGLLLGRDNNGIDTSFISRALDEKKVHNLDIEHIFVSESKRAIQTAERIAEMSGVDIKVTTDLNEIEVDLPEKVYREGNDAIRKYVISEGAKSGRTIGMNILAVKALIVSHSFLTRLTYANLFGIEPLHLLNDRRFTKYLSGFKSGDGKYFTLLKA